MRYEDIRITDGYGNVKLIGRIIGDTFYTWRNNYKEHFFRKYNGWAIDIDMINREDITHYVLHDTENHVEYYATRKDFLTHGKYMNHAGHGEQRCLPLDYWRSYEVVV
jgi:hypothetical protein